jgi:Fe2+ or Zn2+ uptake regulation protein
MKVQIDYSSQLRKMGLKVTPLRLALLEHLIESELPIDAAACAEYLKAKNITFDQVTIYRNLETFVSDGIAKKVDLQGGKYYYEKASDCSHLICDTCGKVEHIHMEENHEAEHAVVEKTGFRISQHVSDFFGTCQACQSPHNA